MNSYKLQTRYAQSLFDLALEQGISDVVYKDMQCVMQVCMQNREFRVILKNPVIKPSDKSRGSDFIRSRACRTCIFPLSSSVPIFKTAVWGAEFDSKILAAALPRRAKS